MACGWNVIHSFNKKKRKKERKEENCYTISSQITTTIKMNRIDDIILNWSIFFFAEPLSRYYKVWKRFSFFFFQFENGSSAEFKTRREENPSRRRKTTREMMSKYKIKMMTKNLLSDAVEIDFLYKFSFFFFKIPNIYYIHIISNCLNVLSCGHSWRISQLYVLFCFFRL